MGLPLFETTQLLDHAQVIRIWTKRFSLTSRRKRHVSP
jgi:hypothetical protein